MTRKEISNCIGDHPRRNTRIYESTYKVYTLAIGGNFGPHQNASFLLSEGSYQVQECVCAFEFEL